MGGSAILIFLLWMFVGALVGGAIGNLRGRPEAGVGFGLLLGPLGWLIVAVGPDFRPKCPECGGVVVEDARRCKNCGQELSSPPTGDLTQARDT